MDCNISIGHIFTVNMPMFLLRLRKGCSCCVFLTKTKCRRVVQLGWEGGCCISLRTKIKATEIPYPSDLKMKKQVPNRPFSVHFKRFRAVSCTEEIISNSCFHFQPAAAATQQRAPAHRCPGSGRAIKGTSGMSPCTNGNVTTQISLLFILLQESTSALWTP